MPLTPSQATKLEAAVAVINELLAESNLPPKGGLSRGPDGRHLDDAAVKTLYAAFAKGMTPYQAHKHFGIAYRAARLRYDAWTASKTS